MPYHITRAFPKKKEELIADGSLYWVFKGFIQARQSIIALEPIFDDDGWQKCKIVMARELYLTKPHPRRAFQGWRYLDNPPPDIKKMSL